ncbi:hypothetical protein [Novipirellula herctigrandis]
MPHNLRCLPFAVYCLAAGIIHAQQRSPEGVIRADAHRFLVKDFIARRETAGR